MNDGSEIEADSCCWPDCAGDRRDQAGPPLCTRHLIVVASYVSTEMDGLALVDPLPPQDERQAARRVTLDGQSQVYYVRIGDVIKIGYSSNMRQRLAALRATRGALLATEPGGRDLEASRHRLFVTERMGKREDFAASGELMAHIASVRATRGEPIVTGDVPLPL